jgi:hypothetical protein
MAGRGRISGEKRLRARRLKNLTSISAWRGQIVDTVISNLIVPEMQMGELIPLENAISRAKALFDRQRKFAKQHAEEDLALVKSHHGDAFALFYEDVYGPDLYPTDFHRAWTDIEEALLNFYGSNTLLERLMEAETYVAQPPLHFDILGDLKGTAYPDLIAYFEDGQIEIIDWKVHHDGTNDARGQLASYAIALSRLKEPNNNFPLDNWQAPAEEIVIKEAQLLIGDVREHKLTPDDIDSAEMFMMQTAFSMSQLHGNKKYQDSDIRDYELSDDPALCDNCAFRMICVEESSHA